MGNLIRYKLHKLYSCLAYAIPFGVLFGFNHEAYISTSSGGKTIVFWGYVIVCFVLIAFKQKVITGFKKDPLLSISLGIFIVSIVMQIIANQLMLISGASVIGCFFMRIPEAVADVYYMRCYKTEGDKRIRLNTITLSAKEAWKQAYGGIKL